MKNNSKIIAGCYSQTAMGNTNKKQQTHKYTLDELNTALLGVILFTVQHKDVKDSRDYETYDGKSLPPGASCDALNSAMLYLAPTTNEMHRDMSNKKKQAIIKYVERTILKDRQTTEDFIKHVTETLLKN